MIIYSAYENIFTCGFPSTRPMLSFIECMHYFTRVQSRKNSPIFCKQMRVGTSNNHGPGTESIYLSPSSAFKAALAFCKSSLCEVTMRRRFCVVDSCDCKFFNVSLKCFSLVMISSPITWSLPSMSSFHCSKSCSQQGAVIQQR